MENDVPEARETASGADSGAQPPDQRFAQRSLAPRYASYRDEVRRLMQAASDLMQRTGGVDPRVGEIVRHALSSRGQLSKQQRSFSLWA